MKKMTDDELAKRRKAKAASKRRHPANLIPSQRYLWSIGKCGSVSQDGYLCTLTTNHRPTNHQAQIMSGIEDGKIMAEWPW
jgi:hypothetical protein